MTEPAVPDSTDVRIGQIEAATERLLRTALALTDEQASEPSLLPDWSRGHVLTHVARNADGLRNLLTWARTGEETPQYPSLDVRNAQIAEGAGRKAADLAADVAESAAAFVAAARQVPPESWDAELRGLRGPSHPAWFTLHRRLFEVEVHHADLDAGYAAADWPDWFVTEQLYRVTGVMDANPQTPAAVLTDSGTGRQYILRPDLMGPGNDELTITGPGHVLLAWLLGRSGGDGLSAYPAGPLPDIPPY